MARTIADLAIQVGVDGVEGVKRALGSVGDSVDGVAGKFGGAFGVAAGNLISGFVQSAGSSLMGLAGSLIGSNAQLETLSQSFQIAVGDADEASRMFGNLQKFAASTPFEFPELIQAATNLEALGIDSEKYLATLGNAASATNHTLDQTTQAFMDASVGEFERLKEFGIQTRREGDNVVFTYMQNGQEITKTVDATNQAVIQSTLAGIWNDKYAGAMDKQSKTFAGLMSTLKDNINMTMAAMGKPIFEFVKKGLAAFVGFFATFDRMRKVGLSPFEAGIVALRVALIKLFGAKYADTIKATINGIAGALITAKNIAGVALGFIADLFGKAFGWIAANGSMVMAALKGIGVAFLAIGAAAAVLAIAGGALALLTSPILLVAAAAAGLGIAWKTNFLGIRDITAKAIAAIMPYVDRFRAWLSGLIAMAPRLLPPIKAAFAGIVGAMQPLVPIFGMVMDVLKRFGSYLIEVARGGDALTSQFSDLPIIGTIFQIIGNSVAFFRDLIVDTVAVVVALIHGDWAGAWDAFKTLIGDALSNIMDRLQLFGQLILDVFNAIDWGALVSGALGLADTLIGYMGPLGEKLLGWLTEGATWAAGQLTTLWDEHGEEIKATAASWIGYLDDIGAMLWGWISGGATWAAGKLVDLWTDHSDEILATAAALVGYLDDVGSLLWGWISGGATWVASQLVDLWTDHKDEIFATAASLIGYIDDVGALLWGWLQDGAIYVAGVLSTLWTAHSDEIGKIPGLFVGLMVNLGSTIWDWMKKGAKYAVDLISGLWTDHSETLKTVAGELVKGLGDLGDQMWTWIKGAASWALEKVTGLGSSALASMSSIGSKLGGAIKSAFNNALSGIGDWIIGHLNSLIGTINGWIEEYNRLPLAPNIGTIPYLGSVGGSSNVGNDRPGIQSVGMSNPKNATGNSGDTVYQTFNITMSVADVKDLIAAAEFVQALPRERQLVLAGGV